MKLWIKNGHVLDPSTGMDQKADVLVCDGRIAAVGEALSPELSAQAADEVIDARGLTVMPGFIDLHVHFREPGFEYKETVKTGALAAAAGGFTSVCPMPNTRPVMDDAKDVEAFLAICKRDALVHVLPVGAVTMDQAGKELAAISQMKEAGICAISEDGKSVMDEALYEQAMRLAAQLDLPVFAHCEDQTLLHGGVMNAGKAAERLGHPGITNEVEDAIIRRDIALAQKTGARLHLCHCSTKNSVEYVRRAKEQGICVTAEVCPHHFTMTEDEITKDQGNYKMNPPLRTKEDVDALIEGLSQNVMEVISTDHAPHGREEKERSIAEAPFGIVGLETSFCLGVTQLVETGKLSRMELVRKMSTNPAKVLGIDKGTLKEGSVADLVLADFDEEWVIDRERFYSKGKNTPFHGKKVKGKVKYTIVDGRIIYREDKKND